MSRNNRITIGVKVIAPPTVIAHSKNHTRNMWEMHVERERKSGNVTDYFMVRFNESACPLKISNDDNSECGIKTGDFVELTGEICSRDTLNRKETLEHIYADYIKITNSVEKNLVRLCGYICPNINIFKDPHKRRKHVAFKLSVKSKGCRNYIRIAASGELADIVEKIGVGGLVDVDGRMQYREYTKTDDGTVNIRGVCEVSARAITVRNLIKDAADKYEEK